MSKCTEIEMQEVCFVPANGTDAPTTLLLHVKRGQNATGSPVSVSILTTANDLNTPLDPATYLGGGTFTVGACPVAQPDIEWSELCERLADGSSSRFFRRTVTVFDAFAVPTTTVTDFELDKVTAYTVTDETQVGDCGCEPLTNTGLVTDIADFQ